MDYYFVAIYNFGSIFGPSSLDIQDFSNREEAIDFRLNEQHLHRPVSKVYRYVPDGLFWILARYQGIVRLEFYTDENDLDQDLIYYKKRMDAFKYGPYMLHNLRLVSGDELINTDFNGLLNQLSGLTVSHSRRVLPFERRRRSRSRSRSR